MDCGSHSVRIAILNVHWPGIEITGRPRWLPKGNISARTPACRCLCAPLVLAYVWQSFIYRLLVFWSSAYRPLVLIDVNGRHYCGQTCQRLLFQFSILGKVLRRTSGSTYKVSTGLASLFQLFFPLQRDLVFLLITLWTTQPLWLDTAPVNKLVPCIWLLCGTLEICCNLFMIEFTKWFFCWRLLTLSISFLGKSACLINYSWH